MRLQLTSAQVTRFAGLSQPRGDLEFIDVFEACMSVLRVFAEHNHDPITKKDMNAVLKAMGQDESEWQQVDQALRSLDRVHNRRGYYTQGSRVNTDATTPTGAPTTSTSASTTPTTPSSTPAPTPKKKSKPPKKAGKPVSWAGFEISEDTPEESWYADDAGLREIAISTTPCYGGFWAEDKNCQACPMARFCARATMALMVAAAAELDATPPPAPAEVTSDSSTVITSPTTSGSSGTTPPPLESASDEGPVPDGVNTLNSFRWDNPCSGCPEIIPEGSFGWHLPSEKFPRFPGLYHPECAKKKLREAGML